MPFRNMYQDLSDSQILQFANNWYDEHVDHPGTRERKKKRFQEALKRDEIEELIRNSVLLNMMVRLNNYEEPPTHRNALYKLCVQFLLNDWDADRVLDGSKYHHRRISTIDKQEILSALAAHIYESNGFNSDARHIIVERELTQIIAKQLVRIGIDDTEKISQEIVNKMRYRDGILYEIGEGYWGFAHHRFFEYCLAQHFRYQFQQRLQGIDELCKLFTEHSDNEHSHGMLSLLAGAIDISFTPKIIESLLSLNGELQGYRNVFLAARCVAEHKWWNEIADSVSVLQERLVVLVGKPKFRLKALDSLKAVESRFYRS